MCRFQKDTTYLEQSAATTQLSGISLPHVSQAGQFNVQRGSINAIFLQSRTESLVGSRRYRTRAASNSCIVQAIAQAGP